MFAGRPLGLPGALRCVGGSAPVHASLIRSFTTHASSRARHMGLGLHPTHLTAAPRCPEPNDAPAGRALAPLPFRGRVAECHCIECNGAHGFRSQRNIREVGRPSFQNSIRVRRGSVERNTGPGEWGPTTPSPCTSPWPERRRAADTGKQVTLFTVIMSHPLQSTPVPSQPARLTRCSQVGHVPRLPCGPRARHRLAHAVRQALAKNTNNTHDLSTRMQRHGAGGMKRQDTPGSKAGVGIFERAQAQPIPRKANAIAVFNTEAHAECLTS